MIDRYSCPEMKKIWDLKSKFDYYLNVELAVCEGYAELGQIPFDAVQKIKKKAKFSIERIDKIEAEVHHDVIAFLTNINESLGKDLSKYMHVGLTSSDVIDTALAMQLRDSGDIIISDIEETLTILKEMAIRYKNSVCIGRSHGIHAELTTFGIKLLNMYDKIDRVYKNFISAKENICVGQISGPVGTYSNVPFELEEIVCKILGLKPAKISTQIIARDYHARYMQALSLIGCVIEDIATEIRHLQRTEVGEVEEGFSKKQKGSSAMPHKKNPVASENLSGLARVLRSNSISAMENIALWHERDISHSSVERIIFPDSTILIDYMLTRFTGVIENLVIKEQNMINNADKYGGIIYSQSCLLKLLDHNMTREEAYKIVQKEALDAFNNNGNFRENMKKHLSDDEIKQCFNQEKYLKNIDTIFKRFV